MNESPKKIWAFAGEIEGWEKEPDWGKPIPYIRADLVDELVGALEGVLPFTLVGKSDDAWGAIDRAIKTLEKIKEEL